MTTVSIKEADLGNVHNKVALVTGILAITFFLILLRNGVLGY